MYLSTQLWRGRLRYTYTGSVGTKGVEFRRSGDEGIESVGGLCCLCCGRVPIWVVYDVVTEIHEEFD